MTLELPEELTLLHVLLAYAGLVIHTLGKLAKAQNQPDFTFKKFVKSHTINFIGSVLLIPVLLIMACDYAGEDTLPINNTTSVLAGYQVNSTFRMLLGLRKKRAKAALDTDEGD